MSETSKLVDYNDLISEITSLSPQTNKLKANKTATQNVRRVANLYKWYTNGSSWDGKDISWLIDTNKIKNFIMQRREWKSPKSKCNQICAIAAILRRFKNDSLYGQFYKYYSTETTRLSNEVYDSLKDNIQTKKTFKRWDDVMKLRPIKLLDRLLYSLYTDIPPRRSEYKNLVLHIDNGLKCKMDQFTNYLCSDSSFTNMNIVLNDYKEAPKKKHGTVEIKLPDKLKCLFRDYISDRKIKTNQRLFTDYTFSLPVTRTFGMGINGIRHSFASWFLDGTRSLREKEDMAKQMGTSLSTLQSSYFKLNLINKTTCRSCINCPLCIASRTSTINSFNQNTDIDDLFEEHLSELQQIGLHTTNSLHNIETNIDISCNDNLMDDRYLTSQDRDDLIEGIFR